MGITTILVVKTAGWTNFPRPTEALHELWLWSVALDMFGNGTVYKTNLVRTKSLSDHGPDQIWLCKRYLSVPKIWSGPKSGPKRDLLMCKDHGPIEFGPVPNLDM